MTVTVDELLEQAKFHRENPQALAVPFLLTLADEIERLRARLERVVPRHEYEAAIQDWRKLDDRRCKEITALERKVTALQNEIGVLQTALEGRGDQISSLYDSVAERTAEADKWKRLYDELQAERPRQQESDTTMAGMDGFRTMQAAENAGQITSAPFPAGDGLFAENARLDRKRTGLEHVVERLAAMLWGESKDAMRNECRGLLHQFAHEIQREIER